MELLQMSAILLCDASSLHYHDFGALCFASDANHLVDKRAQTDSQGS